MLIGRRFGIKTKIEVIKKALYHGPYLIIIDLKLISY